MHKLLRRHIWASIIIATLSAFTTQPARTQIPDSLAQSLQRAIQGEPVQVPDAGNAPPVQIYQPVVPELAQTAPPSRLEALYAARAGTPLKQFGYDTLGVPTAVSLVQAGGVEDNYVLGQGDEIVVVLRGQENATYRQRVNRDGQVILPKLKPILANGRSFGEFRSDLERRIAQAYLSTDAFVSLGEVRQVSVLITGEVRAPGPRILNALATPLDAILLSGGIAKTGSLRNVILIRGSETIPLDLYAIMTKGTMPHIGGLHSGDRIYVPPLHNTVAVTGYVRRPGIYELRDGPGAMDARDLITLAGGIEIAGKYRLSKMSLQPDGSARLVALADANPGPVENGEVLFVDTENDSTFGRVTLTGSVQVPGTYPLSLGSSVRRIIHDATNLACDAYTPFAVIVRRDPILNARTLVPFSLAHIFAGGQDIGLQNDDVVYVFSRNDARILGDVATSQQPARLRPGTLAPAGALAPTAISGESGSATPGDNATGDASLASDKQPFGLEPPCENSQPQEYVQPQTSRAGYTVQAGLAGGQYPPAGSYAAALPRPGLYPQPSSYPLQRPAAPGQTQSSALGYAPLSGAQQGLASLQPPLAPQIAPSPPASGIPPFAPPSDSGAINPGFTEQPTADGIAANVGVSAEALVRVAADHVIWVLDEVRDPGAYLAGEGTTLAEMIETAGGLLRSADLSSVEVTSTKVDPRLGTSQTIRTTYSAMTNEFRTVALQPRDVIRLRRVFSDRLDGRVAVLGEVRYPGTFDIMRGEHLSSVLARAGGPTKDAYPYGAVFTRVRAASSEKDANDRTARELDAQLGTLAVLNTTNSNAATAATPSTIAFLSTLAERVRKTPALGRIVTTVDPGILRAKPDLDIVLEPGDRVFIPPRPSTVTVSGEVLNPGSVQYRPGLTVADYIETAGGETQGADSGRTFVIFPDGTAKPVKETWVSLGNRETIPPGSTVVVPRDLEPFQLSPFLRDVTQIVGQLAITAASLAIIHP